MGAVEGNDSPRGEGDRAQLLLVSGWPGLARLPDRAQTCGSTKLPARDRGLATPVSGLTGAKMARDGQQRAFKARSLIAALTLPAL
jgi:hypothetical protein